MENVAEVFVIEKATTLLDEAGFKQPPVNPLLIGARHEIYFMVRSLPDSATGYRIRQHGESWIVTLAGDVPPEEQTIAAARAIVEILFDIPNEFAETRQQILEMGAEEILMPGPWFDESVKSFGYDVAALKRRFGVTHEAVATRTLRFRPAILTVLDNTRVVSRVASPGIKFSPKPLPAEMEVVQRALESCTYQRVSDVNDVIECQPITRKPGVQRVFCFRVPKESSV